MGLATAPRNRSMLRFYRKICAMSVIDFSKLKEKQDLQKELKEWQERLKLAYEFDWKDPSRAICHSEVKRLKEILGDESILDKISRLS